MEKPEKKDKIGPKAKAAMTKDEPKEKSAKASEKKSEKSDKKDGKKKVKHGFSHTHIEHHSNGSHTVRHVPIDGGTEQSYSAPDLNGVKAGLDQNLGEPEGAEAPVEPPAGAAPAPQTGM